jgi:hypothetical protein
MSDQTRIGDRVSGVGIGPCPRSETADTGPERPRASALPLSDVARYSRMLRPFPIKSLTELLYHVQTSAAQINQTLIALQIDPPREADTWAAALWQLDTTLWELIDYADRARVGLPEMVDRADVEGERAASALRVIVSGLGDRVPKPCPACGGHGGNRADGACPTCQGSAIDPSDPASPL